MLGIAFTDRGDDGVFRCAIHVRDKIVMPLTLDGELVEIVGGTVNNSAGAASRLDGDIEHWMHGRFSQRTIRIRILL